MRRLLNRLPWSQHARATRRYRAALIQLHAWQREERDRMADYRPQLRQIIEGRSWRS